jgi:hypothetical protein
MNTRLQNALLWCCRALHRCTLLPPVVEEALLLPLLPLCSQGCLLPLQLIRRRGDVVARFWILHVVTRAEESNQVKSSQVFPEITLKETLLAGVIFDSLHLNPTCDKASEKRTSTQTYRETHRKLLVESLQRAAWRMEITMNEYASDPQQVVGTLFDLNPQPSTLNHSLMCIRSSAGGRRVS